MGRKKGWFSWRMPQLGEVAKQPTIVEANCSWDFFLKLLYVEKTLSLSLQFSRGNNHLYKEEIKPHSKR